jgi:hypothetical protein
MEGNVSVQKVPYETLQPRLLADRQILEWKAGKRAPERKPRRTKQ